MGAASESEVAAARVHARKAIEFRITLMEMNHRQERTPIEMGNATSHGMLTNTLVPKRSKAIDMRFF